MLLALDTSTHTVGVALYDGNQVLWESIWTSRDYHTVELAPRVDEILSKSGLNTSDLTVLAVAIGPGSFTGLRIGLALAKGLSLAHHLPLVGIPTLDFLAAAQPICADNMAAILRAGRGRLATGWYHRSGETWKPSGSIEALTATELSERIQTPTLVCGELNEEERHLLGRKRKLLLLASPAQSVRRPAYLAELAWQRWQTGHVDNPASLSPFYLHTSDLIPGG
jgi:tRNA threonylcarbamoyladenosine biosynthesis protein TsaB